MWLDNGRKETKKQMAKRMAQERRDKKSGVGGIAVGEEVGADGKKKKGEVLGFRFGFTLELFIPGEWLSFRYGIK